MESKDGSSVVSVDNAAPVEPENCHNDIAEKEEPSPKKPKVEESTPVEKKQRRSSGRKNRCDIDIMEEARAAYGELDASEGRRLRRRPEPPKVEKTPPAQKRTSGGTPGSRKKAEKNQKVETSSGNAVDNQDDKIIEQTSDTENGNVKDAEKEQSVEEPVQENDTEAKQDTEEAVATESSVPDTVKHIETSAAEELQTNDEAPKDNSE